MKTRLYVSKIVLKRRDGKGAWGGGGKELSWWEDVAEPGWTQNVEGGRRGGPKSDASSAQGP